MQMDKASIVGDAVSYVQGLQVQAKNLKAEIATLETTLSRGERAPQYSNKINVPTIYPVAKKIFQVLNETFNALRVG